MPPVQPPVYLDALDGSEKVRILKGGRFYVCTVGQLVALAASPGSVAAVAVRTSALESRATINDMALSAEVQARKDGDAAEAQTRQAADQAEATARAAADTANSAADTALAGRVSALEAKPEEVAHFTVTKALPAVTALTPVTLTRTGLTPSRAGDVLKAGESVTVSAASALPAGVNIANVRVPADGTVEVQLTTGISIALQSTPTTWLITPLR
jgi:hypothetical protein